MLLETTAGMLVGYVEPWLAEKCGFASTDGQIRYCRITRVVVRIEREHRSPGILSAPNPIPVAPKLVGSCTERRISQEYSETVRWKRAGIAQRDREADVDIAGRDKCGPDNLSVLSVSCGNQLKAAGLGNATAFPRADQLLLQRSGTPASGPTNSPAELLTTD